MEDLKKLVFPVGSVLSLPPIPVSYLECRITDEKVVSSDTQNAAPFPFAVTKLFHAEVISASQLTADDNKKAVFEIELNVKDQNANFLPGDTVGIVPKNSKDEVNELLYCLDLEGKGDMGIETFVSAKTSKKKAKVPEYIASKSTPLNILESCLEIRGVLKKGMIRALAEHTENDEEKRRLLELSGPDYPSVISKSICLLDLLKTFSTCKPPLSLLIEHLPRLRARPYSIASSPLESHRSIRIAVSVVEDSGGGRRGVCSGWLADIALRSLPLSLERLTLSDPLPKLDVPMYFRTPTRFRLTEDPTKHLLMIGPGTGVAPFLGFLEHRRAQLKQSADKLAESWLFFGCRHKEKDFIYGNKMSEFLKENILSKLLISFSRDEQSQELPKYVQDNILLHKGEFIAELENNNTYLYLCGEANNMVRNVEEAIVACLSQVKGLTQEEATNYLKALELEGRFLKDSWV